MSELRSFAVGEEQWLCCDVGDVAINGGYYDVPHMPTVLISSLPGALVEGKEPNCWGIELYVDPDEEHEMSLFVVCADLTP